MAKVTPFRRLKPKRPPKPYPKVVCSKHPDRFESGYAVCIHVREGAPVDWFYEADTEEIGEALCKDCHVNREVTADKLLLVCRSCLFSFLAPNSITAALINPESDK